MSDDDYFFLNAFKTNQNKYKSIDQYTVQNWNQWKRESMPCRDKDMKKYEEISMH